MSRRHSEYLAAPPNHDLRGGHKVTAPERGEALPAPLAAEMGARFGVGFGDVRVRSDATADREARRQGAQAYARGNQITFAAGRYDPARSAGRRLIAHELAHVVQQRRGGVSSGSEARAERAAVEALGGRNVNTQALGGAPVGIQAQPADGKTPGAPQGPPSPDDKAGAASTAAGSVGSSDILDDFDLDKDTLKPKHTEAINALASGIAARTTTPGTVRIEIVGHTDTSGEAKHNLKLGQDRADRVRAALEKVLGAAASNVQWSVRSAGESEPLIPTGDNKQEPRNRRVEMRVTGGSVSSSELPASGSDPGKPGSSDQPSGPGKDAPADKGAQGASTPSDKVTTQPPPTQVTTDDLKGGKDDVPAAQGAASPSDKEAKQPSTPQPSQAQEKDSKGEKEKIEKNLTIGAELEKSEKGTELTTPLSFEITFPLSSWKIGPVKFLNEFSLEPSVGVKRGSTPHSLLTPLALDASLKMISAEWEKQTKAGLFKFGLAVGPTVSGEYTPQSKETKLDVLGEGGGEAQYQRNKDSRWFLKVEAKGSGKFGWDGKAHFDWDHATFSIKFGVTF